MEDHIENSTCLQMKPECKREGSARLKDPSQHTKFNHPSADEQRTLESVPTVDRHSSSIRCSGINLIQCVQSLHAKNFKVLMEKIKLGIVVHSCNLHTWDTEAGGSPRVQGQPGLCNKDHLCLRTKSGVREMR